MTRPLRVLLLEDRALDAELMLDELRQAGFAPEWLRVWTERDYLAQLDPALDVILADYSLPSFDAPRALRLLQERGLGTPFIVVTGTVSEEAAVECMKQGATDYLLKDRLARLGGAVTHALEQVRLRDAKRQADQEVRESEKRFRELLETAPDAMVISDDAGRIVLVNSETERLFGYLRDELLGQPDTLLLPTAHRHEPAGQPVNPLAAPADSSMGTGQERKARRKNGTEVDVEITLGTLQTAEGVLVTRAIRDITERRRAEHALRASNERLETVLAELHETQAWIIRQERLRALGEMASGIAHDFNNAVGMIVGFAELLLEDPHAMQNPDEARAKVRQIHSAAIGAGAVVSRLRDFYRPRDRDESLQAVQLNDVIAQAISFTQPRWRDQARSTGQDIRIETHLAPVPTIDGDQGDLREALANLIFNAVDAMPDGGTLSIRTRMDGQDVIIEVADTGVGMPAEVRDRIFEPFFTTKGERGTGLGLALVYGAIHRHGGDIEVASVLGQGTTFTIHLPSGAGSQLSTLSAAEPPIQRGLRVLLAEDEPALRRILTSYLQIDGHQALAAEDGLQALEAFNGNVVDLIVTDRAMPRLNGDQLAAAVRRVPSDVPIIMLTGFGDEMQDVADRPAGVDVVLAKPITLASFRRAITQVMSDETR